jgi:hypothetical protein
MLKTCLMTLPLVMLLAPPVWAVTPPEQDRRVGLEVGNAWLFDDWQAPDSTHYQLNGRMSRLALNGRVPGAAAWEAQATGSFTPILRTDSNALVQQFGGRLLLTGSQGRYSQLGKIKDSWVDLGLGLILDGQAHAGPAPVGRDRDFLDEGQLRLGPVGTLDIIWLHPTNAAWRVWLHCLVIPRALGLSTGKVLYPGAWSGVELKMGPTYRWKSAEFSAGADIKYWQGDQFADRETGLYLKATTTL